MSRSVAGRNTASGTASAGSSLLASPPPAAGVLSPPVPRLAAGGRPFASPTAASAVRSSMGAAGASARAFASPLGGRRTAQVAAPIPGSASKPPRASLMPALSTASGDETGRAAADADNAQLLERADNASSRLLQLAQAQNQAKGVIVAARIRPMNHSERVRAGTAGVGIDALVLEKQRCVIADAPSGRVSVYHSDVLPGHPAYSGSGLLKAPEHFTFDAAFDCNSTQAEVFAQVGQKALTSLLSGFNASILCYG